MNYLHLLLIAVPVAIIGSFLNWNDTLLFVISAIGIIPLAGLIGEGTEHLAEKTGPKLGGLLNATLGNAAELIITIFAIRANLLELVKASITGSILGNLLLVLGASILFGGLKNGRQKFERTQASMNATMLILAVIALVVPSIFSATIQAESNGETHTHIESLANAVSNINPDVEALSLSVAAVMIAIYAVAVFYSFRSKEDGPLSRPAVHSEATKGWTVRKSLIVLLLSTAAIAWMSEILVGAVEHVLEGLGWTEFFMGIIIIPIVGNVAEHLVGVQVAIKNRMDLSMEISVGSSLQIALFVAPALVFISLLMGNPLTLEFNNFELIALISAALIAALVALDGESNWLEGAQLLVVYVILALAFFFLPVG
ncbi:MAG: calcium/proton exchanger [Anaerolineales bacterium]|nr:calcium/proton exchanger [Anaerolineales bacterium]